MERQLKQKSASEGKNLILKDKVNKLESECACQKELQERSMVSNEKKTAVLQKKLQEKARSKASKDHQTDKEDLGCSGIIPFMEYSDNFNPAKTIECYLSRLNQDCDLLFQRPKRLSKQLNLHDEIKATANALMSSDISKKSTGY